jgi:predicted ABC-type ATPase
LSVKPTLLIIAGPNGSGKTTVTVELRRDRWSEGVEYLNPDDVAEERFGGWNSHEAVLAAAKWVTARREELLASHAGMAFETVFSAPDKVDFVRKAKDLGYFVRVFFVGTADPKINASRVMGRVMGGGHSVPMEKILSRYTKSMANLSAAIALADRVYLFDNSVENDAARLYARTESGELRKIYADLPTWISEAVLALPRHRDFVDMRSQENEVQETSIRR